MEELTILLHGECSTPLYEQIYEYIRQDIIDGKISPGEKLPSTRLLAKHLAVSRSTTDLAYGQLLSEGYVHAVPGSGYYVCDIKKDWLLSEGDGESVHKKEAKSPGLSGAENREKSRSFQYDFSMNGVEWSDFSMASFQKAVKHMLQEGMEGLFDPGIPQGEENLRQEICSYLHQARGVNCDADQMIVGAGNEYLLMLLDQMFQKDRRIAMESPTYHQAYQTFCNLGWETVSIPMDEEGMEVEELKHSGASLAYIMPSHQFPMGSVMPMKRRMELLHWAGEEQGRYIIEDDHDSEFRYKGKPIPSLQGSDPLGRVIYLGTFSKSIAPAIRVSYMVLPRKLLEVYRNRCGFYSSTVSRVQQQILYYFMKEGYFGRHLNKMRRIYRSRHDALILALKDKMWVKRIWGENAGLHVLVEVASGKGEEEIVRLAMERNVRAYGLGEYVIRPESEREHPVLLLGYGGLTEEQITAGVRILGEVIEESPERENSFQRYPKNPEYRILDK